MGDIQIRNNSNKLSKFTRFQEKSVSKVRDREKYSTENKILKSLLFYNKNSYCGEQN